MAGTVTYQCPCCDAGLLFDADKQKFCCEFCLSEFTETELANTGTAEKAEETLKEQEEYCSHMSEYHCPNCGAEIIVDENTAADFCYYCHNPVILTGRLAGEMQPKKIVPFQYDKDAAKEQFMKWVKKYKYVPNDFYCEEQIDKIQGVYFPFWVTDADTTSRIDAKGHRTRSWTRGNYRYTETSRFRLTRGGKIHFEDIVTSALSNGDKEMLEGILPFPADSEAHRDFSMAYLSGFHTKKRNLERSDVNDEVRLRMEKYASDILKNTIQSYSAVSVDHLDLDVHKSSWEYTLMPVWILTYKDKKDKIFTFAMNGYTGKVYGQIPVSFWKLARLAASIFVPLAALIILIGGFL